MRWAQDPNESAPARAANGISQASLKSQPFQKPLQQLLCISSETLGETPDQLGLEASHFELLSDSLGLCHTDGQHHIGIHTRPHRTGN